MGHAEYAGQLFLEGYNCAQAVFGAFANEMGLPLADAARLASGLGAGMGRLRDTCGAVSGMVLAASMLRGYQDPKAVKEKKETYQMIQELVNRFKEENGAYVCRELLGAKNADTDPGSPSDRTAGYYKKRPCKELVEQAAQILEDYLQAHPAQ